MQRQNYPFAHVLLDGIRLRVNLMKLKELKVLTVAELYAKERDFRQELFNLRLQQATGQLDKPSRLHELKVDIARVMTLLNQAKHKSV